MPPTGATATSANPGPDLRPVDKVLVVVEENESSSGAYAAMPYLSHLAATYARIDGFQAVAHPSLPNYLALAGGSTFGVHDDHGPTSHPISGDTIFGQALAAGRTAKVYAEGMSGPCARSGHRYAVRHTGWPYFVDERGLCNRYDVPLGTPQAGALADDVATGTLPAVGWAIPNLCDDGHDCALGVADTWLASLMELVMSGDDWRSGRLLVVVTFDEGSGADQQVATVAANLRFTRRVVSGSFTHYSLVRLIDSIIGAPPLRQAAGAADLRGPLGL